MKIVVCACVLITAALGFTAYYFRGPDCSGLSLGARMAGDMIVLSRHLEVFRSVTGRLPSDDEGLSVLHANDIGEPAARYAVLPKQLKDPWQRPYQYRVAPATKLGYKLFSSGPDAADQSDDIYPQPPNE